MTAEIELTPEEKTELYKAKEKARLKAKYKKYKEQHQARQRAGLSRKRSIIRMYCKTPGCHHAPSHHIGLCHGCYADPEKRKAVPKGDFLNRGLGLESPKPGVMCQPTEHPPGTLGKLLALETRAVLGQPLWHPDDAVTPVRDLG